MPKPALSIFLITRNEADRLGRTLAAISALSDDVIVVDSGSSDGTTDIASRHGARVFNRDWPGYGPQKRFAEEQCRHDWLLNLDADEVMPAELAVEIMTLFEGAGPEADAYTMRIAEIFPGEGKPHRFAYTLRPIRLYKKSMGRYSASTVHDRVVLAAGARVAALAGILHHFSIRSIGDQITKLNAYTDQQVDDLSKSGKQVAYWRLFVEFPAAFLKAYILRRHFLRGGYGFMTAMNFAFYRWLRVAKDVERRKMTSQQRRDIL